MVLVDKRTAARVRGLQSPLAGLKRSIRTTGSSLMRKVRGLVPSSYAVDRVGALLTFPGEDLAGHRLLLGQATGGFEFAEHFGGHCCPAQCRGDPPEG